jgi:hypothetical protein
MRQILLRADLQFTAPDTSLQYTLEEDDKKIIIAYNYCLIFIEEIYHAFF